MSSTYLISDMPILFGSLLAGLVFIQFRAKKLKTRLRYPVAK
ncbi:MAG: thiamine phosphate synthase [Clostridiales bacterium]|nr:thiamine phosphate synthase [Clostridiales bacterium]